MKNKVELGKIISLAAMERTEIERAEMFLSLIKNQY